MKIMLPTPHFNPNVKRAYPVHDNGETRETKINFQPVDPFQFFLWVQMMVQVQWEIIKIDP